MLKSKITTKLSLVVLKKVSDFVSLTYNGKRSNIQILHMLFPSWRFTRILKSEKHCSKETNILLIIQQIFIKCLCQTLP